MKKLQNDFTTPEQSKRLLELGVPADSADCYYDKCASLLAGEWEYKCFIGESVAIKNNLFSYRNGYTIPCWSVGRLIEIYELCSGKKYERKSARLVREGNVSVMKELTIIEDVIGDIKNARLYIYPHIDFSKLED